MKENEKPYLETIQPGEKITDLCCPVKGLYRLKKGQNKIKVIDKKGKYIRLKVVTYTGDDSKVVKSMQDETDIKYILEKFGRTGMLPIVKDEALYGDFSSVPDYQQAQNILIQAERQFSALSSDVRKKFDNDPAEFLRFCNNPENKEEMYELGLAVRPKAVEPTKVEVINQPKEPQS